MGKVPATVVEERKEAVRDLIVAGKTKQHIVSYMRSKYGISLPTVENYITMVNKDMVAYMRKHRDDIIAEHIARYEKVYDDCLQMGNHRDALKALKQKEELLQLLKADPLVAINTINMNFENMTVEELKGLLNGTNGPTT